MRTIQSCNRNKRHCNQGTRENTSAEKRCLNIKMIHILCQNYIDYIHFFIFKCFLFTWGKIFRLYLLFINTRTNMTLVIIIAIESNNKQTNLETFSNATRVDGNSKPCQTLSLWHDTFHTGFGSITISFGMIGIFLFESKCQDVPSFIQL